MIWLVMPLVTVTLAVLEEVVLLASAFTVSSLSLEPEPGETVSHDWSLDAVHDELLKRTTVCVPPSAVKSSELVEVER